MKFCQTPLSIILCNTIFKVSICLVTDEGLGKERILFKKLNELHPMHCIKETALKVALLQMQSCLNERMEEGPHLLCPMIASAESRAGGQYPLWVIRMEME